MSNIAITVENLSKRYQIGHAQQRHDTLRDALADVFKGIHLRKRNRSYGDHDYIWALKDVSFEVAHGEVIGIIGRNGAGKSTLLKILSRITEPTSGRAVINGRVGSLLEVGTGFHGELTGRENIYLNGAILGMRKFEIDRKFDEIVSFSEIEKFLDTPVKRYSSGMYVRLAFAVAAQLEPEILLVDEVLAVGDTAFQKKCLGRMGDIAKIGRTVFFVSHNMAAISGLCEKVMVLDQGVIETIAEPSRAIQDYMSLFTSDSLQTTFTNLSSRARKGDGPIRFTSFHCESEYGHTVNHLVSGQKAKFIVNYKSTQNNELLNVYVSIVVYTIEGIRISNLSNVYQKYPFLSVPPHGRFICELPKLPLRSGRYILDLYCNVDGDVSDWIEYAASFDVADGDYYGTGKITEYYTGSVFLEHSWSNQ